MLSYLVLWTSETSSDVYKPQTQPYESEIPEKNPGVLHFVQAYQQALRELLEPSQAAVANNVIYIEPYLGACCAQPS